MATVTRSGGPGKGAFRLEWRGAEVQAAWRAQVESGMDAFSKVVLADLRQTIHEITGRMRREAFAVVSVAQTKRTLGAGSAAPYAFYEERNHPQIRQVVDRQAPRLTAIIAAARGRS